MRMLSLGLAGWTLLTGPLRPQPPLLFPSLHASAACPRDAAHAALHRPPCPAQELEKFEKLAALPSIQEALADKYSQWDAGGWA